MNEIVRHLQKALEVDYVVLGGGNAARLTRVPAGVRIGNNLNAFVGGLRLWQLSADKRLLLPAALRHAGSAA